jgi:hypothetical protein
MKEENFVRMKDKGYEGLRIQDKGLLFISKFAST